MTDDELKKMLIDELDAIKNLCSRIMVELDGDEEPDWERIEVWFVLLRRRTWEGAARMHRR